VREGERRGERHDDDGDALFVRCVQRLYRSISQATYSLRRVCSHEAWGRRIHQRGSAIENSEKTKEREGKRIRDTM